MEIWKDIPNFEGLYQASNLGRIKSVKRYYIQFNGYGFYKHSYKERILSQQKNKNGYMIINLSKNCKKYTKLVHRLVAQAFLENKMNYEEINHINGNKQDNRVDNLEWCNRLYNQREAEKLNLVKSPIRIRGYGNPLNKSIVMIDNDNKILKEFYSITQASETIGCTLKHLSYCLINGKKDKITNNYWKYKEEL